MIHYVVQQSIICIYSFDDSRRGVPWPLLTWPLGLRADLAGTIGLGGASGWGAEFVLLCIDGGGGRVLPPTPTKLATTTLPSEHPYCSQRSKGLKLLTTSLSWSRARDMGFFADAWRPAA